MAASSAILHGAGVTLLAATMAWLVALPQSCHEEELCKEKLMSYPGFNHHAISTAGMVVMFGHEIVSLVAIYMGTQEVQAIVPHLQSRCLPSFLLALMFAVLSVTEAMFSRSDWTLAHVMPSADGLTEVGRPVYTLQYFEWCINVPILMVLAGYCALGRPLHELVGPIVVTNVYVIMCWCATVSSYAWMKWDMLGWCAAYDRTAPVDLPSRSLRPLLSSGLASYLLLYGVVYLSSAFGIIDAHAERKSFSLLTMGSKIAYCSAFVVIRANEYHKTLTELLRKVSNSNVGMISILRGSFDIILPCVLDAAGCCKLPQTYSGDMAKLENILGFPVAGSNLKELLAGTDEAEHFAAYVRNIVRQADSPQGFSDATLSLQGTWSCAQGEMPPIAQVLHSKMQRKECGTPVQKLNATLHLSVVPRSSLSFGRERQLVAAIQFMEQDPHEKEGVSLASPAFESFNAAKVQDSTASASTLSGSECESGLQDASQFQGIVASLADLTKLGVSAILQGSVSGKSENEDAESWAHYAGSMCSDETMSHMGAFVPHGKQDAEETMGKRLAGAWEGTVSRALGGYKQCIEFSPDGTQATVTVMGHTLPARCQINCSKEPAHMDIQVVPEGSSFPPPAIPYIFKFQAGCLHLCGPSSNTMVRPQAFAGPGLCIMERVNKVMQNGTMTRFSTENEPDPEFSRKTTDESSGSGSEESPVSGIKEEEGQDPTSKTHPLAWVQEQHAISAISALVAVVAAAVALRKAL